MAGSKLKIEMRRNKILELLRTEGKVSVIRLSQLLGTTAVTIRNDLTTLEREGYLIRTQGGAVPVPRTDENQRIAHAAKSENVDEKRQIANVIADMIRDGDTLFINSGTTAELIASALKIRSNLNIVTNSLTTAMILGDVPTFRVVLLGGSLNANYGFTYGTDAQTQLAKFQADWAILSVDGVSIRGGITTHHVEEAVIDRMMIAGARSAWVAVDHSKIGRAGFARICDITDRIGLITTNTENDALNDLESAGVRIVYVQ